MKVITGKDLLHRMKSWEYDEGETVYVQLPMCIGKPPREWLSKIRPHTFDASRVYVARNVELAGPNLAGFYGSDLILPVGYYGRVDLWERNAPYFEYALLAREYPEKHIPCAFSMVGVWSGNYFHWLLDHIPTLKAYNEYKEISGETPLILIGANPPKFVTDSLDMLGLDYHIDDCYHYRVDRLVIPTWPREDGYMRPSAAKYIQDLYGLRRESDDDYYITRKNAARRRVVNEEELINEFDLIKVEMEKRTLWQQQITMSLARTIVGPHGAGLANMVFGDRLKIIELATPDYTNPCLWLVACALGFDYGLVMCSPEPGDKEDMAVNIEDFKRVWEMMHV